MLTVNKNLDTIALRIEQKIGDSKAKNGRRFINGEGIKNKIINLLKHTSRPIAYHEIAESLSQDFRDHDFNSILKELDQLEKKGEIIGQVAAGKLYFQLKH